MLQCSQSGAQEFGEMAIYLRNLEFHLEELRSTNCQKSMLEFMEKSEAVVAWVNASANKATALANLATRFDDPALITDGGDSSKEFSGFSGRCDFQ